MTEPKAIKEEIEKPSSEDSQSPADQGDAMRTVERILRKRIHETVLQYRVKWLGLPHSENTWVPEEDLDYPELIEEYREKKRKKKPDEDTTLEENGDQSGETATEEDVLEEPSKGKKRSIQSAKPALSVIQPAPKKNKAISAAKKKDGADAFYEVETILCKMMKNASAQYKVKWKTFADPSWEPASNLQYCDLVDQYEEGLKKKQASKRAASTKSVASKPSATTTPVVPAGILNQMPPRSLSDGISSCHPRVSPHESPTGKSDTEIFGQLVVRKLNDMSPFDVGQAEVEILQIINKVKFSVCN